MCIACIYTYIQLHMQWYMIPCIVNKTYGLVIYIFISVLLTSMYILLSDITYQYVYIYIYDCTLYTQIWDISGSHVTWRHPSLHCPGPAAQWSLHLRRLVGVLRWGPSFVGAWTWTSTSLLGVWDGNHGIIELDGKILTGNLWKPLYLMVKTHGFPVKIVP